MIIKIVIADTYPIFREGIKSVLRKEKEMNIVAETESAEDVIKLTKRFNPDIVLLDLSISKKNDFEIIKSLSLHTHIIVMLGKEKEAFKKELNKLGLCSCILKTSSASLLPYFIRQIFLTEKTSSSSQFINNTSVYSDIKDETFQLTRRELEVLQMIAKGKSNFEIAEELYLSEKTVKNHLTNIFRKIEVSDRTQALIYALKNDLVFL